MCDAGVMAKHNPVPLGRWLRPRVEDERRTVPTSREEREGFFRFWSLLYLPKMEVAVQDAWRLDPYVRGELHTYMCGSGYGVSAETSALSRSVSIASRMRQCSEKR